jgi:phosphate transport system permease protein
MFARGARYDRIFRSLTSFSASAVLLVVVGIFVSLMIGAWPSIKAFGWGFISSAAWNPVTEQFGGLVAIFGTLVTALIALLIAVPISFGIALFITQLAPSWLKRPLSIAVELLAAIPSIIYGMWGLFVFAPKFAELQPWISEHFGALPVVGQLFQGPPMGIGLFTASLILAIMIIPFISAIMRDVFDVVPKVLKECAF